MSSISIAQEIHRKNNPIHDSDAIMEDLLIIIGEQNGDFLKAIQNLMQTLPQAEVHFGEEAPATPIGGDLWYKPSENRLYAYVQ